MTQEEIRKRRRELAKRLLSTSDKLRTLQHTCTHPNATKKYGSNAGNYDPSSDWYWIEYRCEDCGKFWTEKQ